MAEYCGAYYSDELDITYQLMLEGTQLVVKPGYAKTQPLRTASTDIFMGEQIDLRFERNHQAQPDRFYLGAGRQRNLEFVKQQSPVIR